MLCRATALFLLPSLAALSIPAAARSEPAQGTQPNLLLIIADDVGVESVNLDGSGTFYTPTLKLMSEAGVRFDRVWSQPRCSPTRASLYTGRYGLRTGVGYPYSYDAVSGAGATDHPLSSAEVTLAWLLGDAGYACGMFGKWHLGHDDNALAGSGNPLTSPLASGYEIFEGTMSSPPPGADGYEQYTWISNSAEVDDGPGPKPYPARRTVDAAHAWIDLQEAAGRPWFATVAFNLAHAPFHCPDSADYPFALPCELLEQAGTVSSLDRYKAMVYAMDAEILHLLSEVDLATTTVLFVGDNGTPDSVSETPGRAKGTLFEGGVHVPLIAVGAGVDVAPLGPPCARLVNTVDVFLTLAELGQADLSGPGSLLDGVELDSVSLVPYLANPTGPALREFVFAEDFYPNGTGLPTAIETWSPGDPLVEYPAAPQFGGSDLSLVVRGRPTFTVGNELELELSRSAPGPAYDFQLLGGGPAPVAFHGQVFHLPESESSLQIALSGDDLQDLLGAYFSHPSTAIPFGVPGPFPFYFTLVHWPTADAPGGPPPASATLSSWVEGSFAWPGGHAVRYGDFKLVR
ncbi:MAG: sulfatase-like hydrolase/transferase [Planctomycetota bacterium]